MANRTDHLALLPKRTRELRVHGITRQVNNRPVPSHIKDDVVLVRVDLREGLRVGELVFDGGVFEEFDALGVGFVWLGVVCEPRCRRGGGRRERAHLDATGIERWVGAFGCGEIDLYVGRQNCSNKKHGQFEYTFTKALACGVLTVVRMSGLGEEPPLQTTGTIQFSNILRGRVTVKVRTDFLPVRVVSTEVNTKRTWGAISVGSDR